MTSVQRVVELLNLSDLPTAEQVIALQRQSYQVEADLIGFDGIPPLHESLEDLQACQEIFYGIWAGTNIAGAIAYEHQGEFVEICRLMVHPTWFRKGIATQLLRFVEDANASTQAFRVSTGSKNHPAIQLYQGVGFIADGETEVAPGIFTTQLEKRSFRSV